MIGVITVVVADCIRIGVDEVVVLKLLIAVTGSGSKIISIVFSMELVAQLVEIIKLFTMVILLKSANIDHK